MTQLLIHQHTACILLVWIPYSFIAEQFLHASSVLRAAYVIISEKKQYDVSMVCTLRTTAEREAERAAAAVAAGAAIGSWAPEVDPLPTTTHNMYMLVADNSPIFHFSFLVLLFLPVRDSRGGPITFPLNDHFSSYGYMPHQ